MELQGRPQKAGTQHASVDPASHKLLNSPSTQPEHAHAHHRSSVKFRVVGQMVLALKRFQNALNPTYSYGEGKEVAKENPRTPVVIYHAQQPQPTTLVGKLLSGRTGSGRTGSGRTSSGRPNEVGKQHGHKGDLLFKPLPAPEVQS